MPEPWPTPKAFRAFVDRLDQPGPGLVALAAEATDGELTGLAETICERVEPDMSTSELGAAALTTGSAIDELAPTGRTSAFAPGEVSLVFGSLAGLHCPERLPLSGRRLTADPPSELDRGIGGFRSTVADRWPDRHRLPVFLDTIDDERLARLADRACGAANRGHSEAQFGLATRSHYDDALTTDEQTRLGPTAHHELFGALVGWFCAQRLPSID